MGTLMSKSYHENRLSSAVRRFEKSLKTPRPEAWKLLNATKPVPEACRGRCLTNYISGSTNVTIAYNGDGDRVSKTVNGTTTLFLVDTRNLSGYAQVLEELTTSGGSTNLARTYTYGHDLISQRQLSPLLITFYGYDGHGSVRFLTATNGNITDMYTYDAYGTLIASSGSTVNLYLYASEQWEADVGAYFLRARYMNANTGRLIVPVQRETPVGGKC